MLGVMWSVCVFAIVAIVVQEASARGESSECLPMSDERCASATSTATLNEKAFCCLAPQTTITVSSNSINGVVTATCKCSSDAPPFPHFHVPVVPAFVMPNLGLFHQPPHNRDNRYAFNRPNF